MNEQEFEKQLNALHERVLSKALSDEEKNNDIVNIGVAFRAKCKIFSRHLQKPILKTEKGRFKGL